MLRMTLVAVLVVVVVVVAVVVVTLVPMFYSVRRNVSIVAVLAATIAAVAGRGRQRYNQQLLLVFALVEIAGRNVTDVAVSFDTSLRRRITYTTYITAAENGCVLMSLLLMLLLL